MPRVNVEALVARREAAGISQAELARRAAISRAYLSMIESGARQCGLAVVMRIAAELDCLVDDLLVEAPVEEVAS